MQTFFVCMPLQTLFYNYLISSSRLYLDVEHKENMNGCFVLFFYLLPVAPASSHARGGWHTYYEETRIEQNESFLAMYEQSQTTILYCAS